MQLTEKQKFWLIQFIKFALFTAVWFWAWLGPIWEQIMHLYPKGKRMGWDFGMLLYPLFLALAFWCDSRMRQKQVKLYWQFFVLIILLTGTLLSWWQLSVISQFIFTKILLPIFS